MPQIPALTLIWQAGQPQELYLTDRGLAVFATAAVKDRNAAPADARIVATIEADIATMRQMTSNMNLTPIGNYFCKAWGVTQTADSLIAYVTNSPEAKRASCHLSL